MKKKIQFLACCLAFAILMGNQGISVLAETISENNTQWNDLENGKMMEQLEGETLSCNTVNERSEDEEAQSEATEGKENVQTEIKEVALDISNPVYNASAKKGSWSYVYMGSYPQSEVTDQATIAAIDNVLGDEGSKETVWINGVKYTRLYFSSYSPWRKSSSGYRYYKWERIKWRVLKNDGKTLFLMTDKALLAEVYGKLGSGIGWSREDTFFNDVFSTREKKAVQVREFTTKENPVYGTKRANRTEHMALAAVEDITNPEYGFSEDPAASDEGRQIEVTDYVRHTSKMINEYDKKGDQVYPDYRSAEWYLRTSGYVDEDGKETSALVKADGKIDFKGCKTRVDDEDYYYALDRAWVLTMHVNLNSNAWLLEDDGTSGDGGEDRVLTNISATMKKTHYLCGETLNPNDLVVTASYQKHGQCVLSEEDYMTNLSDIDMNTAGTKTITVTYTEGMKVKTASVNIQVRDEVKVNSVTVKAPYKKVAAGKKVNLTLTVMPKNADNLSVTWKSSNNKYATVDTKGMVFCKKAGGGKNVTITAVANDGSAQRASVKIKIMKHAVKSIKLRAPSKKLRAGKSMKLKATVKTTGKNANKTLKWNSSNTAYAVVNSKGKVTAKKAGKGKKVIITATATDGTNKRASVKIKIK